MGLSFQGRRILERLRNAIQTQGQRSLDDIRARLHDLAQNEKREATEKDFVAATAGDGVISVEEAGTLFRDLASGGERMPFAEILRALRCPTSRQRVVLARAVFDMIDQDRDSLLSYDQVIACYRAANHPDVRRGLRACAEVRQDFIQTLWDAATMDANNHGDILTFPAFLDFYCSLTAFTSEDHFRETISTVWVPPVARDNEQAFALQILGCAGGLAANLRVQILRHGVKGVSTFRRGVRDAVERGGVGEISQEAFCASAGRAGAKFAASEMAEVFRYLDRRGTGMILAADALRAVLGELSEHRKGKIDEAFDLLLDESGTSVDSGKGDHTLDSTLVITRFRAEAHPDVVSGTKHHQEVLADLMEALEGARLTGGRVHRSAWREHHWDISALIDDDDAFCSYLECVWGARIKESAEFRSAEPLDRNDRLLRASASLPCDATSFSDRPAASAYSYNDFITTTTGPRQSYRDGNRQIAGASHVPRDAWIHQPMIRPGQAVVEQNKRNVRDADACQSVSPGILAVLDRARDNLSAGGVRGVSFLLKAFRKEDRTGNGMITLSGFKTAAGRAGIGLKEAEMRILFEFLDGAADGEIPYQRFLKKIRKPLPPHRLALVNQAFDGMDEDGDGLALVEDITKAFRANAHPQVMEGCRDEKEVQREFLETFAVGDGARRCCTRDDFIRWMELISLSLPTPAADNTFERLVRGCWGIPETTDGDHNNNCRLRADTAPSVAEGCCREYDPVRVVATRADGSTSVEEVARGLGSIPGNKRGGRSEVCGRNGMISRAQAEVIRQELAARGVHAVHVQLLPEQQEVGNPSTTAEGGCPLKAGRYSYSAHDVRIAKLGPAVDRNASSESGVQRRAETDGFGLNRGLQSVLAVARERLASRGPAGFFALSGLLHSTGFFRSHPAFSPARPSTAPSIPAMKAEDSGGNGPFVSLSNFKHILSEMGCGLNGKDMTQVFMHLDLQGRGEIPVEMALEAIRGRLTGVRLALVRAVFSRLKGGGYWHGDAAAATADVLAHFDPQGHPEVIAARRSPEDVRKEFMDVMTTTNGLVTWKDFENYYADVSAATPVDPYFILLVRACWGLGATAAAKAASAATAAVPPNNTSENDGRRRGDYHAVTTRRMYPKAKTSAHPGVLPGTTHPAKAITCEFRTSGQRMRVPTAGVTAILRKLRAEIQSQGTSWGLAGLRRALLHADRNRDRFLSFGEFKAALASLQMGMTAGETRALFAHLETEAVLCVGVGAGYTSGVTSCQALLDAIRPPLNGERLGLVRLAFRRMDRRGEGRVSPETVAQRFDASKHPAVLKGHATVEEIHQELLDTFFSVGADDGKVSKGDFIEHHSDLSFSVPSDSEFRQLVLNCWGIDSDSDDVRDRMPSDEIATEEMDLKQACRARTRRRHFAVTNLDGSQAVEELPFPSERREDDEAPLTAAEEKALKQSLFRRDKIHATEVALLPKRFQCGKPSSDSADHPRLSAEDPAVDRRSAWAWAPMSLSEIHTADETAAAVGAASPIRSTRDRREDAGEGDRGNGRHACSSSSISKEGNPEIQNNGPTGDVVHNSPDDRRVSEESWEYEKKGIAGAENDRARLRNRWKTETEIEKDQEADPSVRYLLSMLRSELNVRGVTGMASLCRRLREAMTTVVFSGRSARVVKEVDFRRALRETISPLTESDTRRIFSYFEIRDLGIMDPEAFVNCLYGYMSEKRKKLVLSVFHKLDTTGIGRVEVDQAVRGRYDVIHQVLDAFHATRHPEIVSGCRSPDVVFREFVEGFVGGLRSDTRTNLRGGGIVTREDFCKYYDIISATIPDDGSFELLLMTCWRMPKPDGFDEVAHDHRLDKRTVKPRAEGGEIHDTLRGEIHGCSKSETECRHFSGEIGSSSHCATSPVTLPPKQTRERSSMTQAAGGDPGGNFRSRRNDESHRLRTAHIARAFDTQITFGEGRGVRETHRCTHDRQAISAIPLGGGKTPLAAGSGRGGRKAEGAAWTPGGRRLVPGSRVFMSHLGNGMRVARDEAGRLIDHLSPLGEKTVDNSGGAPLDGDMRRWMNAEKKSRAAASSREPPVWVPKQGHKSTKLAGLSDTLANARNDVDPYDPLSLAKVANDAKSDSSCSDTDESSSNMPDQQRSSVKWVASRMKRASEDYTRRPLPGGACEEDWSPSASSTCVRTAKDERKGVHDRWGNGYLPGTGDIIQQDGRQRVASRPRDPPSDTYRSSLVFG